MRNEELDKLILGYAKNKAEMDSYKKICDKENAKIKSIMKELKEPTYEVGEYRAVYSEQKRETMNEEMLLEILGGGAREMGIVKTKEYVDFDALEKAIYDDLISQETVAEMAKAREVKIVPVLKVSKIKKKKEE